MSYKQFAILLVVCVGCTRQQETGTSQTKQSDNTSEKSTWIDPSKKQSGDMSELPFAQQLQVLMQNANAEETRRDYSAAVDARKQILALIEKQFGQESWQATNARISLENTQHKGRLTAGQHKLLDEVAGLEIAASQASDAGKLPAAVEAYAKILKIGPQIWPESSNALANYAFRKAEVHLAAADHSNAEPLYDFALAIQEKTLGRNHPDYAKTLNSLGVLYQQTGQHEKARQALLSACDLTGKIWGQDSVQLASCLNNLGTLWFAIGQYNDAEYVLDRALAIRRKSLGDLHTHCADTRYNLGTVYLAERNYDGATEQLQIATRIYENNVGPEHPSTIRTISNLAVAYRWTNEYAKAEPLLIRVVQYGKSQWGPSHEATLESTVRLGIVLGFQAKYKEAQPLLAEALKEQERIYGDDSPRLLPALRAYAVLLDRVGRKAESGRIVSRVQSIETRIASKKTTEQAVQR